MLLVEVLKSNTNVKKTTNADNGNKINARWCAGLINIRKSSKKLRIRKVRRSAIIKLDLIEYSDIS